MDMERRPVTPEEHVSAEREMLRTGSIDPGLLLDMNITRAGWGPEEQLVYELLTSLPGLPAPQVPKPVRRDPGPGSRAGRPAGAVLQLAVAHAKGLVAGGAKKDVAALEAAEQFGVSTSTVRKRLQGHLG